MSAATSANPRLRDETAPGLRIYLLGRLELSWRADPLSAPSSAAARSLLAYLALLRGQPVSRTRLAGLFWPERPDARARRALSHALWQIRSALGPAADRLAAEQDTVALTLLADDWLDVAAFESLASPDHETANRGREGPAQASIPGYQPLIEAISLYRGDLLEECYDDWALLERERLRELYLRMLERLLTLSKQQNDYGQALAVAQRLVAADPLHEAAHCELMRLFHLLGRPHAALHQFAALRDLLQQELGITPAQSTTALYHEIAASLEEPTSPHLPVPPPSPPLLLNDLAHLPFAGRVNERAVLLDTLQSAAQGHGGLAFIEGDVGVGKTRLVEEIVADARWRGFQVAIGKAEQWTATGPYQVLRDALAPLLTPLRVAQLAELVEPTWLGAAALLFPTIVAQLPDLPPLAPLDPKEEQSRLWEGLARCLSGLAAAAPLLLVLEDLHWADEATLEVLPRLIPRLPNDRLLLILTCRTAEARERAAFCDTLETLDRTAFPLRLRLRPFERAEAVTLVQRALSIGRADAQAAAFAERLQDETGGNALFLVESLKSLLEQGSLAPTPAGGWSLPPAEQVLPVPVSIQRLVGERLARLDRPLRTVAELVAVLGEDASLPVLTRTCGMPPAAMLSALETLGRYGFLLEAETHHRFEHDRVREIVYQTIPTEQRQQWHRRAGEVLEALSPERVESLAFHFERGGRATKALVYTARAGERAVALHAYRAALDYYDRSLALADEASAAPPERFDLLAAREAILDTLGERARQEADLEGMIALVGDDARRTAQARRREAQFLAHVGRYAEAQEAACQALTLAEQEDDREGQIAALTVLGRVLDWAGHPSQAVPHLERAAALCRDGQDAQGEAQVHFALGSALLGVKAYTDAGAALGRALSLYVSLGDRLDEAETLNTLGILCMERGDTDGAIASYERALAVAREIGYRYGEARALGNLGTLLYVQGQIGQALEMYGEAISTFQAIGQRRGEAQMRINRASVFCSMIGGDDSCLADAQAALDYSRSAGDAIGQGQCLSVMGQIALQQDRLDEARSHLEAGLALLLKAGERWIAVQVYDHLILMALRQKRPREALRYAKEADTICRELGLADLAVNVLALRGLTLSALAQPEAALAAAREAVERLKPGVAQAHLTFYWRYRVLEAAGQREEAQAALEQAWQLLNAALEGLTPAQREMSLARVPEHRAIGEARQAIQAHPTVVRLPRADAPTGRPLREDEWVEGEWTVAAPEDTTISDRAQRRRHQLLRLLREAAQQSAAPTVENLAEALGTTARTIKRDLAALRAEGHDVRTRGARARR